MNHLSKQGRANINFYNCDNISFMKSKPDNFYKLAIVDPEYGINIENSGTHFKKYNTKGWDNSIPDKEYFYELKRVSENQIIWGGNYFLDYLSSTKCMIIWDKKIAEKMSFAMCEIAWTSFDKGSKIYSRIAAQDSRIHPTQKPIKLYKWLLDNYAKQGDNILDTNGGSASIALACWDLGFDLDLCELDEDYFNDSWKRFETHSRQQQLF